MKSAVEIIHSTTSVPVLTLITCMKTLLLTEKTKHDCPVFGYMSSIYLHLLSFLFLETGLQQHSLSVDFTTAIAKCSACWPIQSSGALHGWCHRKPRKCCTTENTNTGCVSCCEEAHHRAMPNHKGNSQGDNSAVQLWQRCKQTLTRT